MGDLGVALNDAVVPVAPEPVPADLTDRVRLVETAIEVARSQPPDFAGATQLQTMLAAEEVAFLYLVARDVVRGWGSVVELGSFLGGSTVALGQGLIDGEVDARIDTFDAFRPGAWPAFGVAEGEVVLDRWERNVQGVRQLVDVHPGLIEDHQRDDERPIELLFVDIVDSAAVNALVTEQFVSRLRAGSILVHQDLFHWGSPWVAITVESLWEHLTYVGHVARSSGVFVVKDSLAEAARALRWEDISPAAGLVLIDSLAARFGHPSLRGTIELAALYLARTVDPGLFERRRAALEPLMTGTRIKRFFDEVVGADRPDPKGQLR